MNTAFDPDSDSNLVVFRVDGGRAVGGGHIARCDALAQLLQTRGWQIRFAMTPSAFENLPASGTEIPAWNFPLTDDAGPEREISEMQTAWPDGCDLLVVDHYGRDASFEKACRPWARRVLAIDDLPNRSHDCDVLLDQTFGREAAEYDDRIGPDVIRLCGSAYALLRPEFAGCAGLVERSASDGAKPVERILVSMGATDPHNATALVLDGIRESGLEAYVDIVLGQSAPHAEQIRSVAAKMTAGATLHLGVKNPAPLLATADIAVGAGGVSAWERCCFGLPTIMMPLFDNQRDVVARLAQAGAVRTIDKDAFGAAAIAQALKALATDTPTRTEMSRCARLVADGRGVARAGLALDPETTPNGGAVRLRPATMGDADILLDWQRHPDTRRYFRSAEIPSADAHHSWMSARLSDPGCLLSLVLNKEVPAGVVRLDPIADASTHRGSFEISILIAPDHKRQGIGLAALNAARRLVPEADFHAEVADGNAASAALFSAAGYSPAQRGGFVSTGSPQLRGTAL